MKQNRAKGQHEKHFIFNQPIFVFLCFVINPVSFKWVDSFPRVKIWICLSKKRNIIFFLLKWLLNVIVNSTYQYKHWSKWFRKLIMFQFKFNLRQRDVSFNSNMFSGSQKCIGRSVPRVPVPVDHLRVKRRNCEVTHKQKHGFN